MNIPFATNLFLVLTAALLGGLLVKFLKLQPILGYIIAGIALGSVYPLGKESIEMLAEIGVILLLFSVGIELSFSKLKKVINIAVFGATVQILLVTLLSFIVLGLVGITWQVALVLSLGFSLSSTAIVVKILADRGETETIHGGIMIGWLLIQDLAVIPMMVILPTLTGFSDGVIFSVLKLLLQASLAVIITWFLGRLVAPFLIHKVSSLNSRELLVLSAISLALGTAYLTSLLGISAALGAFLAGVVISESQENHAVFSETRPLRDLFVALFFVSLGFFVNPALILGNFAIISGLSLFVLVVKFLVIFFLVILLGYHGKTAMAIGFGLAQVGEFAFIIFTQAKALSILSEEQTSIGIAVALITLILTPPLFRVITPFWRKLKEISLKNKTLEKFVLGWNREVDSKKEELINHVIICGYGRVGSWVGKALQDIGLTFIAIDYNQAVVSEVSKQGILAIYGDPGEPEVLEAAGVRNAKVVVVAIPDRTVQEDLVGYVQTVNPDAKLIVRTHFDEDYAKLKILKVHKIVQPEFEAAMAMVKSILVSMGKSKKEVSERIKGLRTSRAKL